jgi:hypothetical protein
MSLMETGQGYDTTKLHSDGLTDAEKPVRFDVLQWCC